ncbi:hypothetical protein LY76DRAFT_193624 [Colletotrichum caudatum]|nr:hypothetical protein LY76DRAFT_193624 [Colletotrichum caudatum]
MQSEIVIFRPAPVCFIVLSAVFWFITYAIKPALILWYTYRQLPPRVSSTNMPSPDITDGTPSTAGQQSLLTLPQPTFSRLDARRRKKDGIKTT